MDFWQPPGILTSEGKPGRNAGSESDSGKGTSVATQASADLHCEDTVGPAASLRSRISGNGSPLCYPRPASPLTNRVSIAAQQSNAVSKERIMKGQDVRTTVCIICLLDYPPVFL